MKNILRSLLALLAAFLVGSIVVFLIELPAIFVHPWPPGLSMNDQAGVAAHMGKAPPLAMAIVTLAWALGPFAGTLAACLIVRKRYVVHGLIIGVLFALLDASNYGMFPHPLWMMVAGIFLPPLTAIAAAWLAGWLLPPKSCPHQPYDMRQKNMAC